MFKKLSLLVFVFFVTALGGPWPTRALAAVIRSTGPTKVLIVFSEDDGFQVGDTIFAYFPDGSRKATLVIKIIKNRQAIAEIREGAPEEGDAVRLPPVKYGPGAKIDPKSGPAFWAKYGMLNVMAGASLVSQSVKLTNNTSVSLNGTTPFLRASISNNWSGREGLVWDLGAAIDLFSMKGSTSNAVCARSTNCEMNLIGLTPSARIGYKLAPDLLDLQVRGGLDLFIPATVSSNVVDYAPLIPLPFVTLGFFAQKKFSDSSAIPIALDYALYVGDQNVKIARLLLSVGYAWK